MTDRTHDRITAVVGVLPWAVLAGGVLFIIYMAATGHPIKWMPF